MKKCLFLSLFFAFLLGEEIPRTKKNSAETAYELVQRGDKKKKEGDVLRALQLYERSYEIYPNSFTAIRLSSVLSLLGRDSEVISLLESHPESIPKAELLLARSEKNLGNSEKAIAHYSAYCSQKKARLNPKIELIELFLEEERLEEAAALLEEIKSEPMRPSQKQRYVLQTALLAIREGKSVAVETDDLALKGELLLYSGSPKEALQLFTENNLQKSSSYLHALLFLAEEEKEGAYERLEEAEALLLSMPPSNRRTLIAVHYLLAKELLTGDKALLTIARALLDELPKGLAKRRFFSERLSPLAEDYRGPFAGELLLNRARALLNRAGRSYSDKEAQDALKQFTALYKGKFGPRFKEAAAKGALEALLLIREPERALFEFASWKGEELSYQISLGKAYFAAKHLKEAEELLQKVPGKEAELTLAHILAAKGSSSLAKEAYLAWLERYGDASEALLALAHVEEELGGEGAKLKQKLLVRFPKSEEAKEAYFTLYKADDYLSGNEAALRHLKETPEQYRGSPWAVEAAFMLGLHYAQDIKSSSGVLLRKKDELLASDSFFLAEELFEETLKKNRMCAKEVDYFGWIAFRAKVERALIQLNLATKATGPERRLYLNHALSLLTPFEKGNEKRRRWIDLIGKRDPSLFTEARYLLIKTELELGDWERAERELISLEEEMESGRITKSHWLSMIHFERGELLKRQGKNEEALIAFLNAEKATLDNPLQRLALWIAKGETLLLLNRLDEAMITLTRAIDEDIPSAKRLQAMYLRAEVYEREGRSDLALIQLKALSKQEGEWGQKAKEKLSL